MKLISVWGNGYRQKNKEATLYPAEQKISRILQLNIKLLLTPIKWEVKIRTLLYIIHTEREIRNQCVTTKESEALELTVPGWKSLFGFISDLAMCRDCTFFLSLHCFLISNAEIILLSDAKGEPLLVCMFEEVIVWVNNRLKYFLDVKV